MTSLLRNIIGAAWRRRFLIFVPFVVLTVLSVMATILLPKTYMSTALILLQEEGGSNPLDRAGSQSRDMRARVAALEALLKSDRVLIEVIRRHVGVNPDDAPAYAALLLEELRQRLTMRIIGNQFIEINLTGSKPVELRDELNLVVERLFEMLLLPSTATLSATEFLVQRQAEKIAVLEAQRDQVAAEGGDLSPLALGAKIEERNAAAAIIGSARTEAAEADAALREGVAAVLGDNRALRPLDAEIAELTSQVPSASPEAATELQQKIAALDALLPLEARAIETKRIADAAEARLAAAEQELSTHAALVEQRTSIEQSLAAAREEFEEYSARFASQREKTLIILQAPEQLKLVDAPQVPKRPSNSALKILVAGIAAGIALGCGLAVVAEQLDQSLRGEEDLAGVTKLPVLARLPSLKVEERTALSRYGVAGDAPPPQDGSSSSRASFSALDGGKKESAVS